MEETTTQEASPSEDLIQFDDEMSFLNHIFTQAPKEELVTVPDWGNVQVLCQALNAEDRIKCQLAAYDTTSKTTDYRRAVYEVVMSGCYNPKTRKRIFTPAHRQRIMQDPRNGSAVEYLFMVVLRLSSMLASDQEKARKN